MCSPETVALRLRLPPNRPLPGVCTVSAASTPGRRRRVRESARSACGPRARAGVVSVLSLLVSLLAPSAHAQQAESPDPLTGGPAIDAWVRTTFGQPVDPETLDDPIWGTRTLLALTAGQREGVRLFMQRCNVCHGAAMNSMDAYAEPAARPRR